MLKLTERGVVAVDWNGGVVHLNDGFSPSAYNGFGANGGDGFDADGFGGTDNLTPADAGNGSGCRNCVS